MIYGERIRLRSVEKADLDDFLVWINDPEVTFGLSLYLPLSRWEEEEWFASLSKRPQAERPLAVEMRDGENWKLIGNLGYHQIDHVAHAGEVGIMIGEKSVWDQGYGTEAMRLLLKHGFETLNLNRIFLRVYAKNKRAIRTYEKVGFVHEGRMREALFKHGSYQDIFFMSVLRKEWK